MEIPFFEQEKDFTCGAASVRMVLAYFGLEETEENLALELNTMKENTENDSLVIPFQKMGLYCYAKDNADYSQIESFLTDGVPVIINYREPDKNEGHFAVVTSSDANGIILNDPWHGAGFHLERADFEKRWVSEDGRHPRWLLAVSRKEFKP